MKGREMLTVARFPVSRRRGCGQIGDSGEVLVASGDDEVDDDAREKTVSSGAWSALSIASCGEAGERLETCRAAGASGL
jgi:hypothetical protein